MLGPPPLLAMGWLAPSPSMPMRWLATPRLTRCTIAREARCH